MNFVGYKSIAISVRCQSGLFLCPFRILIKESKKINMKLVDCYGIKIIIKIIINNKSKK